MSRRSFSQSFMSDRTALAPDAGTGEVRSRCKAREAFEREQRKIDLFGQISHGVMQGHPAGDGAILCGETGGGGDRLLVGARCH
jgi:hypothetical protein